MSVFEQIQKLLKENLVDYKLQEHQAVRTAAEAALVRGVDLRTGAKSMVIKAQGLYYLLVIPGDKRLDWKKVKSVLGVKEVRFATEEEAEKVVGVRMGSVPPFGNLFNLPTYFDPTLLGNKILHFNPGSVTHTISVATPDLVRLVSPQVAPLI